MISGLDYDIKFPITKKDYCWAEKKNSICINVFCYKMVWFTNSCIGGKI